MNDILLDPPPAPQPEKKDTVTFNKKNLVIILLSLLLIVLVPVILFTATSGSDSTSTSTKSSHVIDEDENSSSVTVATAPPFNKYDAYLEHVYNNSGQANTMAKAKLIEFGDLVCQALDNGNSIRQVVALLESYGKTTSDLELFASVVYGSIHYICDEYVGDLNAYLSN